MTHLREAMIDLIMSIADDSEDSKLSTGEWSAELLIGGCSAGRIITCWEKIKDMEWD